MARQLKEKAKRREAAVSLPQLPQVEPAPPAPAEEQDIVLSPLDAELAVPEALQAGDGDAKPSRHQRASFAARVRNWLGRAA